jgi:transcriptional regulator of aromatic amino acid metabolism
VPSKRLELVTEVLHLLVGQHADLRVLQRDSIAAVLILHDAIEPHHFTHHLKSGDLTATVWGDELRLEEPPPNNIERVERIAYLEE